MTTSVRQLFDDDDADDNELLGDLEDPDLDFDFDNGEDEDEDDEAEAEAETETEADEEWLDAATRLQRRQRAPRLSRGTPAPRRVSS